MKFIFGLLTGLCLAAGAVTAYSVITNTKSRHEAISFEQQQLIERRNRAQPCRNLLNDNTDIALSATAQEHKKVLIENCMNSLVMFDDFRIFTDRDQARLCLEIKIGKEKYKIPHEEMPLVAEDLSQKC